MIPCDQFRDHLMEYRARLLPDAVMRELATHAAVCAACAVTLQAADHMDDDLQHMYLPPQVSAEFADRVSALLSPKRKLSVLAWATLAAAVLLITVGRLFWSGSSPANPVAPSPVISAARLYVNDIYMESAEEPKARIENLTTGMEGVYRNGDRVQDATVAAVRANEVEFKEQDRIRVVPLQPCTDQARAAVVMDLKSRAATGGLADSEWEQFSQFARRDFAPAMEALEDLAKQPNPRARDRALAALYGEKSVTLLSRLLQRAAEKSFIYRADAVAGLAKVDAPLSRRALRSIALDPSDPQRLVAIRALARMQDTAVLDDMQALSADEKTETGIREAAADACRQILEHGE